MTTLELSRRTFIKASVMGLAGLTLGCRPGTAHADESAVPAAADVNIWINIAPDSQITIVVVKAEMGQGVATALPMIVAEELEADWQDIRVVLKGELDDYAVSGMPVTAGSMSIISSYTIMRQVGALGREMLMTAAARRWGVDPGSVTAAKSRVTHPDFGSLSYGELAEEASLLPVPENPVLKDPADFTLIGSSLERLDTPEHLTGASVFGIDAVVPGMRYAAVRQAPVFGGEVANFDALSLDHTSAEAIVAIPNGIAVVAAGWWEAERAAAGLDIEFNNPPGAETMGSAEVSSQLAQDLKRPGTRMLRRGFARSALKRAAVSAQATYEVPYLAHACLEPMTCTAQVTATSCEIWVSTQGAAVVRQVARAVTGLDSAAIAVHTTYVGGGFGRKAEGDYVEHAILASQAVGKPVKVIWSRQEDIQHDRYRPACAISFAGGIDADGKISSLVIKSAGSAIFKFFYRTFSAAAGFADMFYDIPNGSARNVISEKLNVPVGTWRS
ncbi:MAG: xanthine dehydrogenase family protein molybdopterin-binding subunit, partial [Deltaproteobacteria bacterium]|nr:xanthine dehydrogenase family protein molybdopterin-binding subunit [Deltaproteobacteria bacterium]